MNKLMEAFGEIAKLSWETEQEFLSTIQRKQVAKKELLQKEGAVCDDIFFIEKGIAWTFYYRNGISLNWIAAENEFVGHGKLFSGNKLVETLKDTIFWVSITTNWNTCIRLLKSRNAWDVFSLIRHNTSGGKI